MHLKQRLRSHLRPAVLATSLLGCGRDSPAAPEADAAASADLRALIAAKRPDLARCADPVRAIVRQRDPGAGRVGVEVRAVGARGRPLEVRSAAVVSKLGPELAACVRAALLGTASAIASADYAVTMRLHLCVDPLGGPRVP